jgi:hypothetical protein
VNVLRKPVVTSGRLIVNMNLAKGTADAEAFHVPKRDFDGCRVESLSPYVLFSLSRVLERFPDCRFDPMRSIDGPNKHVCGLTESLPPEPLKKRLRDVLPIYQHVNVDHAARCYFNPCDV